HLPALMAQVAFQPDLRWSGVFFRRRKFDSPVVDTRVQKLNAVNVASIGFPDAAHQANGRFKAWFPNTQRQCFFRCERVLRKNPCSMSAQHYRSGLFRENFPCLVRADQDDGELLRDSSTSSHTTPEQSSTFRGPIAISTIRRVVRNSRREPILPPHYERASLGRGRFVRGNDLILGLRQRLGDGAERVRQVVRIVGKALKRG